MKTSCGLLITDGTLLLLCHPTLGKSNLWDIPKGIQEDGEDPIDCVNREVYEETGLVNDEDSLLDLGIWDYKKEKKLHLFLTFQDVMPDTTKMKCNSTFSRYGKEHPEVDGYMVYPVSLIGDYLNRKMASVIHSALHRFVSSQN